MDDHLELYDIKWPTPTHLAHLALSAPRFISSPTIGRTRTTVKRLRSTSRKSTETFATLCTTVESPSLEVRLAFSCHQTLLLTVLTSNHFFLPRPLSREAGFFTKPCRNSCLLRELSAISQQPVPTLRSNHDRSHDLSIFTEKGRWLA
jgi:hypothetical protein